MLKRIAQTLSDLWTPRTAKVFLLANLVSRARAGERAAAAELVRDYEPAVLRVIRLRLRAQRLRAVECSMDTWPTESAISCHRGSDRNDLVRLARLLKVINTFVHLKSVKQ